jgi:probable HAF family extracellular repeat protein
MRPNTRCTFSVAIIATSLASSVVVAQVTFVPLGSLAGYDSSFASSISADGQWVVGHCSNSATNGAAGFRWSEGTGMQDIGTVIGASSFDVVLSSDGLAITGTYRDPEGNFTAFRWRSFDGLRDLGHFGTDPTSWGVAVSNLGLAVIGTRDSSLQPFRWTEQTGLQEILPLVPSDALFLPAVSADGSVVVGTEDPGFPGPTWAVRLANGAPLQRLPAAGWHIASALAVNADGSVIAGEVSNGGARPCLWVSGNGPRLLDLVPGWSSALPTAISGDGTTVVGSGESGGFMWRPTLGAVDFGAYLVSLGADLRGWSDLTPTSVDGEGRTVVGGAFHNGHSEAWLARFSVAPCYANCDGSSAPPILNVGDFVCFQSAFMVGDPIANCDGSTAAPRLNIADYVCFMARFVAGCD